MTPTMHATRISFLAGAVLLAGVSVSVAEVIEGSITHEIHPTEPIARVGTNLEYGRALELGYAPRNLAPRPYLRAALHKNRKRILAIFAEKRTIF